MPRPKKPGAGEPKRRSRNGCWSCKSRKIKCGEEKPRCMNCERQGEACDYSLRLNWGGRSKRSLDDGVAGASMSASGMSSARNTPHVMDFSAEGLESPSTSSGLSNGLQHSRVKVPRHSRSHSAASAPMSGVALIDPELVRMSSSQSQSIPAIESNPHIRDARIQPTPAPFNVERFRDLGYISPGAFSYETSSVRNTNYSAVSAVSPPSMSPPVRNNAYTTSYSRQSIESNSTESPAAISDAGPPTSYTALVNMPLTPNSSVGSEDPCLGVASTKQTSTGYSPTDLRKLSVQSLLGSFGENIQHVRQARQYPIVNAEYTTYGYDVGIPDLDTPRNDDVNAIAVFSPPVGHAELDGETQFGTRGEVKSNREMAFESGGYYAKPVPIKISKAFEPLPTLLLENPMNLLYFHHFLNHTARILVPHDCERNPFREILPEMALKNENILSLLLAYSAAHRARMLNHPEPVNRIALWVRDVFPKLRQCLASATNLSAITNDTLAPAIMMASLEIISPNTFEVPISWQNHLTMARQMILARGGPKSLDRSDHAAYFLSRWFAYLDVLGSLSGNKNDQPLDSFYWSSENASADEDFQIDCLTGFTNRCVGSLARIAELAKRVEPLRIGSDGNINEAFHPNDTITAQAYAIEKELQEGLHPLNIPAAKPCSCLSDQDSDSAHHRKAEIHATNKMFHWAGLIHLYRRVLNFPSSHVQVQSAVHEIVQLLNEVRRGSSGEACLLFPLFAAGCDAQDAILREKIMERFMEMEGFGMVQMGRAREVLESVWRTGKAWESLVKGEFLG